MNPLTDQPTPLTGRQLWHLSRQARRRRRRKGIETARYQRLAMRGVPRLDRR